MCGLSSTDGFLQDGRSQRGVSPVFLLPGAVRAHLVSDRDAGRHAAVCGLLQEVQTQLVREESAGGCRDDADETQVVYAAQ